MRMSEQGLRLLKVSEAFAAHPYEHDDDVPTIGYGSTRYEDGTAVTMDDPPITMERGLQLLALTLPAREAFVRAMVVVPLTQGQFDALVDFVYNVGNGNFRSSTLLRLLNAGDYGGAADQFKRWIYRKGKKLNGLVTRNERRKQLFLFGYWS